MAVTIGIEEVKRSIRVGDSEAETAEVGRLLALATIIVQDYAPHAPGALQDEAAIRLIGYLYDQPTLSRPGQYSAAVRNCGMASLLSQYRSIRAGGIGAAPGTGAGGAVLPPGSDRGNVSAFSFRSAGKLQEFTNSTGGQFVPIDVAAGESLDRVLLKEEIPGPIFPDTDFFMQLTGFVQVQPSDARHDFTFEFTVRHEFGASFEKVIETSRTVGQRVARDQEYSLPLSVFDSVTTVRVGEFETQDDRTVEITADDLTLPSRITITLSIREQSSGTAFTLEIYQSALASYRAYQLRQAVATGIDVDLANFTNRLDALSAEIARLATQRLPEFPDAGDRNDKVAKFDGDVLAWETDAGVQSDWGETDHEAPSFIVNKPNLDATYAKISALNATDAALNALDGDVRQNATDIATKAAESSLMALNQEVNRFGTQAEANRVKLNNLNLPNAPDATSAAALYELQVATDGTVTWETAAAPAPGGGLLGANTEFLGAVNFPRANTLNANVSQVEFTTEQSDAIRAFLSKTDDRDLFVILAINFDGDGSSIVEVDEFASQSIYLQGAKSTDALKHLHFNLPYAQVTGDPANTSRGEISLLVPEATKKASVIIDISANLKSANALRNTTTVDVFVYGRQFQPVQEAGLPTAPAALDKDAVYELEVDKDGAVSWTLAPNVPNLPDAPKTDGSSTKKYELQVADTALVTWVETESGGGGGFTRTQLNPSEAKDGGYMSISVSDSDWNTDFDPVTLKVLPTALAGAELLNFMSSTKLKAIEVRWRYLDLRAAIIQERIISSGPFFLTDEDLSARNLSMWIDWPQRVADGGPPGGISLNWFGAETDSFADKMFFETIVRPSRQKQECRPRPSPQASDPAVCGLQIIGITYG